MNRRTLALTLAAGAAGVLYWSLRPGVRVVPGVRISGNLWNRKKPASQIVIHESVSPSRERTISDLRGKGLDVHYIVERDGSVTQHVPDNLAAAHAGNEHNDPSIAIEYVNRYYVPGDPNIQKALVASGSRIINAKWAHKGAYVVPPQVQLEAGYRLTKLIISRNRTIPKTFPGTAGGVFKWGRIAQHHVPGIMAHARWDHSDGAFPEHYTWLRFRGYSPIDAYVRTLDAAQR